VGGKTLENSSGTNGGFNASNLEIKAQPVPSLMIDQFSATINVFDDDSLCTHANNLKGVTEFRDIATSDKGYFLSHISSTLDRLIVLVK